MNVTEGTKTLNLSHQQHLADEGFTLDQIAEWQRQGLESLTEEQAAERGFRVSTKDGWKSGSGLYIPFNKDFGQLRLDAPLERQNGDVAKYLTPCGTKSQAAIPDGCKVITEGAKDARAGTVHGGIPTGAIAGVSHYRKALPQGMGYTILFDSDGWTNPSVFTHLFHAGKWLNGRVQLLPLIEAQPKAGLCEYFKAGHTPEDYKKLLDAAMKAEALLLEWGNHFKDIPAAKLDRAIHVAFRLAAEYLCDIQQEQLLNSIKAATRLSSKTLRAVLEKERAKVLKRRRKQLEKNLEKTLGEDPNPHQTRRNTVLERRAAALLDSGALLDLIGILLGKIGAVGIEDHVKLAVASTLGTLRKDRKRNTPTLFTGSSGIGKSMVLDILGDLLPEGKSDRVSGVSDAVLKRIGAKWQGKTLLIDEFSTWANSETVLSVLKELITRGETSFEIVEQGQKGEWEPKRFNVRGPIGIAACATDATIRTIFKETEEEIRSRFNELPLPEDADYINRISRAAFSGLEPESLRERFPHIVALIHRATELAVQRKVPVIEPLLSEALWQHIKPDRPLFPRLMKRLKILLENTAALMGKQVIDLETYAVVYPLVSKVFRRNLTNANDTTLDNFVRFARNLTKDAAAGGYLPFKVAKVQEALSASQSTAYRWCNCWESLNWITQGEGRGFWNVTGIGAQQVELLLEGKDPGLPDILPSVTKVKATMERLSQNSHSNSHEILTRLNIPERPIYKGLSDFFASRNSHQILTDFSSPPELQSTHNQAFEVDGGSPNSQNSHLQGRNGVENFSPQPGDCEQNFSYHPPQNGEKSENLEEQNDCNSYHESDTATSQGEKNVRTLEKSVRKTEQVEPDFSTFPHLDSDDIRAKRNQAQQIRQRLLDGKTRDELTAIRKEFGARFEWVWQNLLTGAERKSLRAIAQTEQLDLLTKQPTKTIGSGQRVRVHMKGSQRDGMTGVVTTQKAEEGQLIVRLDDNPKLRQLAAANPRHNMWLMEVPIENLELIG